MRGGSAVYAQGAREQALVGCELLDELNCLSNGAIHELQRVQIERGYGPVLRKFMFSLRNQVVMSTSNRMNAIVRAVP